jgi:hypothetical protein
VGKQADNERLGMLYEPGNWGDILKGTWAVAVAQAATLLLQRKPVRYLDPFAGAPTYALTDSARQRMHDLSTTELARHASTFMAKNEWPSAALLIRAACKEHGSSTPMRVFDTEETRRGAWTDIPDATVCEGTTGEEILAATDPDNAPCDLILVDPYDFLADWKALLAQVLRLSERMGVLCYMYNRAPRSAGQLNLYRRFRKALDKGLAGRPFILGRLASDEYLPRAYHEMLFAAPARWMSALREPLRQQTIWLAKRSAEAGAFEEA